MLHRFFCGGKLPNINNLALEGRKGWRGCSSMTGMMFSMMEGFLNFFKNLLMFWRKVLELFKKAQGLSKYGVYSFGFGSFLAKSTMLYTYSLIHASE